MKYNTSDFVEILNDQIMVNMLGGESGVVVAEDLANIIEYGKAVSALSGDDLKDFKKQLVVGCYNKVIKRVIVSKTYRFLKDKIEFGGGLQRIMATGLLSSQESHILNLDPNHGSYHDGKYYGLPVDSKVYLQTLAKKVVYSIADDEFKQKFMNAGDVSEFIALIMTTVENTLTAQLNELSKRLLVMLTAQAIGDARKIDLLTEFNAYCGYSGSSAKTFSQIKQDRLLTAQFGDFCKMTIERVISYMEDINQKYNDGSVVTFTPSENVGKVFISEFLSFIKYMGDPVDINAPASAQVDRINSWQTTGTDILPDLSTTAKITLDNGTETPTSYTNVVGIVYDTDSCGITNVVEKTTVEPVGAEGFTNYHVHRADKYYCDARLGAVAFTLN